MKIINNKAILAACMLFIGSICSIHSHAATKEKLYGGWSCKLEIEDSGMKMSIESSDDYVRNGTINRTGSLNVQFSPERPKISYTISGSGTWHLENEYLTTTFKFLKIKNISHPEFDDVINLQDMFPENISRSSKITSLTNTTLSLMSEPDGKTYQCHRKSSPTAAYLEGIIFVQL